MQTSEDRQKHRREYLKRYLHEYHLKHYKPVKHQICICKNCRIEFIAKRRAAEKFCSKKCNNQYHSKLWRKANVELAKNNHRAYVKTNMYKQQIYFGATNCYRCGKRSVMRVYVAHNLITKTITFQSISFTHTTKYGMYDGFCIATGSRARDLFGSTIDRALAVADASKGSYVSMVKRG